MLKFFKYSDEHVHYLVVAPDLGSAKDYLFDGDADVRPPKAGDDFEHFKWSRVSAERAAQIHVMQDEGSSRVPLVQCADGDWFCTEY